MNNAQEGLSRLVSDCSGILQNVTTKRDIL